MIEPEDLTPLFSEEMDIHGWLHFAFVEAYEVFTKFLFSGDNLCEKAEPKDHAENDGRNFSLHCSRFIGHIGPHVACTYKGAYDRRPIYLTHW